MNAKMAFWHWSQNAGVLSTENSINFLKQSSLLRKICAAVGQMNMQYKMSKVFIAIEIYLHMSVTLMSLKASYHILTKTGNTNPAGLQTPLIILLLIIPLMTSSSLSSRMTQN
jgi:hypothetical protein